MNTRLCRECQTTAADVFCDCESPVVCLCPAHLSQHIQLHPGAQHNSHPVSEYTRWTGLLKVKEQAWRGVSKVDKAIAQYSAAVEQVSQEYMTKAEQEILGLQKNIEQIQAKIAATIIKHKQVLRNLQVQAQAQVEKLNDMKQDLSRQVASALREVESTLSVDKSQFTTEYGLLFRQIIDNWQSFSLFKFSIQTSHEPAVTITATRLPGQKLLSRQPSKSLVPQPSKGTITVQPTKFPTIYGSSLRLYDLKTQQVTQRTLSKQFTYGTAYVALDNETMMCIGAHPASCEVTVLDLVTLKFTVQTALRTAREAPGVIGLGGCVYVFGGWQQSSHSLSSCEKCSLQDKQWRSVRPMSVGRSYFTPSCHQTLVYLASLCPNTSTGVESYQPATDVFTPLPVSLTQQPSENYSVSFVAKGELCLLTNFSQLHRWKIDSGRDFRTSATRRGCCSTQSPLIADSLVLIACGGSVVKFNLDSYSFVN